MKCSHNGKKWKDLHDLRVKLPQRLKVGVVAESDSEGTLKAHFDQFLLTLLVKAR